MLKCKFNYHFDFFIILLCCFLSFLCRISFILKFEPIISEADSRFNWRCTQYIEKHGITSFFDWFDNTSWYPQGRFIGKTTYPGLMLISSFIYQIFLFFHIKIRLSTICIYIGPFFSLLIPIFFYLLSQLLTSRRSTSLLSAFFSCMNVVLASCSFSSFFDYQCISVTLILICLFLFLRPFIHSNFQTTQNHFYSINCIQNAILVSLIYGFLSITSGEYVYLANIFALISFFSILFGYFSVNLYLTYSIWFVLGLVMSASLPNNDSKVLFSTTHFFPNLTFIFIQFYSVVYFIRKSLMASQKVINSILLMLSFISVLAIVFVFAHMNCCSLLGRIKYVLFPFLSDENESFYYSVEEQNPTSWSMFFVSLGPLLYALPVGFYILMKKVHKKDLDSFYLVLMTIPTFYFSSTMIRNLPIFSIYFILISSISVDHFLRRSFTSLLQIKKASLFDSILCLILVFCFCLLQVYHSIYFNCDPPYEASLYRQIEVSSNDKNKTEIIESTDFQESLMWIRNNTPMNSKFISLWPHGYQISSHSKRTVFCDGNTNNFTHMNLIHLIYASNEGEAWKIARKLGADYIIVIFGGAAGYKYDDLYYSTTFIKSLEIEYESIKLQNFFNSPYLSSENPTKSAKNSMIFKLSYCNFKNWKLDDHSPGGYDNSRRLRVGGLDFELKLFREVFTSKNWMFRIYHISKESIWK